VTPAIVEGDRSLTAAELDERIRAVSSVIGDIAPPHSVVAVTTDNRLESYELFMGVARSGRAALPLPGFLPRMARSAIKRTARARAVVGVGTGCLDPSTPEYAQNLARSSPAASQYGGALMFGSSGTEGRPKIFSHNLTRMTRYCRDLDLYEYGYSRGQRVFVCTPFAVGVATIVGLLTTLNEATMVIDQRKVTPQVFAEVVNRHGCNMAAAGPTIIRSLIEAGFSSATFPSLRMIHSSSNDLPMELQEKWLRQFPNVALVNLYATTECGLISAKVITEPTRSVGAAFHAIEVRIDSDESGIGEISVRGDSTANKKIGFLGIQDMPKWVAPGDYVGVTDGELVIEGRRSDKILVNGNTVYATSVERAMLTHPGVRAAAVIGVSDRRTGQQVQGFYEGDATEAQVLEYVRSWVPHYAVPKTMTKVGSLPMSPAGKIRKKGLR